MAAAEMSQRRMKVLRNKYRLNFPNLLSWSSSKKLVTEMTVQVIDNSS